MATAVAAANRPTDRHSQCRTLRAINGKYIIESITDRVGTATTGPSTAASTEYEHRRTIAGKAEHHAGQNQRPDNRRPCPGSRDGAEVFGDRGEIKRRNVPPPAGSTGAAQKSPRGELP